MPPHSSQALPKPADAPASGENSSVLRRSSTYTPTLVSSANTAADGPLALA